MAFSELLPKRTFIAIGLPTVLPANVTIDLTIYHVTVKLMRLYHVRFYD